MLLPTWQDGRKYENIPLYQDSVKGMSLHVDALRHKPMESGKEVRQRFLYLE
jgi:hypothetical protein